MKKSILLLITLSLFCSCNKEIANSENDVEYVEVSVKTLYEGLTLTGEEPFTKAETSSNDVWGIQIYSDDNWSLSYFCAIYDDISLLKTIKLIKGKKYGIYASYVPNAKTFLTGIGTTAQTAMPFQVSPHIDRKMEYNIEYYTAVSGDIAIQCTACNLYSNFFCKDRYIYVNSEYIATENGEINLDFKRYNASIVINLHGEGNKSVKVTSPDTRLNNVITLINGEGVYEVTNYAIEHFECELYYIRFKFTSEDNSEIYFDGDIELKRNTKRIYDLNIIPQGEDVPVSVGYEQTPNNDENMGSLNSSLE